MYLFRGSFDSKIFRVQIGGGLTTHFHIFRKFGQISKKNSPILWNLAKLASLLSKPLKFCEIQKKSANVWRKNAKSAVSIENQQQLCRILQKWWKSLEKSPKSGMVQRKKCRSRQELSNEYLLAKIVVDTAENEPLKVVRPPPIRTRKNFTLLRFHHARNAIWTVS